MATVQDTVAEQADRAKAAARTLARADSEAKNAALIAIGDAVLERTDEILEANELDVVAGREAGLDAALVDRLSLDSGRIADIAEGARAVAALPDPVGESLERRTLASGIELEKVRVPLGLIAVVYEARPNVTVDAAALTLKSGNSVLLRGSSTAEHSNAVLGGVVRDAIAGAGLPASAVELVSGGGREELARMATLEGVVDLIIPRGGEGLKAALKEVATVPVIFAAAGNCHVYVHAEADPGIAREIAVNAKVQRPGVCNAAETLLVDSAVVTDLLPAIAGELSAAGVELVGDERARRAAPDVAIGEAIEADWSTEFLALRMAVRVVDTVAEAIEHVNSYGTGHSEAIVTRSESAAEEFVAGIDAACAYVNASTRFTDGFEFGMGAEIGNSTQKLHARGPVGLRELTTIKYVLRGSGQVRA